MLRELEAALTVASAVSDSAADALLWDDVRRQARSASVAHYSLRDEAVAWCASAHSYVEGELAHQDKVGVLRFQENMDQLVERCEGVMEDAVHSICVGERVIYLHTLAAERIMRSLAFAWKLCNWAQSELRWALSAWWVACKKPDLGSMKVEMAVELLDRMFKRWELQVHSNP